MTTEEIFLEIIQIDSESGDEEEMSKYVQNFLIERDIDFSVDKLYQVHCILDGSGESLLFSAHLDTVSPGKNIKPIIHNDGKITSDGTTILGGDDKAGVAAVLKFIDIWSKKDLSERRRLECLFTTREEITPSGASKFDNSKIVSRKGFIFDKGNEPINTLVLSAPYITEVEIEFIGKSSHASRPELGINSLEMLNEFIHSLPNGLGYPYEGSTLNFGTITGGDVTNTVPGKLLISGDYRSNSKDLMKKIQTDLINAKDKTISKFSESAIKINEVVYCEGYEHDTSDEFINEIKQAYSRAGFDSLNMIHTQAGSDACVFNNSGKDLEVYNLGDGVHLMHSTEEYTTQENLENLSKILLELAEVNL